jgi:hypothetical protein
VFLESRTATATATGATSTQLPLGLLKLLRRQPTSTQLPPLLLKLLFRQIILVLSIELHHNVADETPGLSLWQGGRI